MRNVAHVFLDGEHLVDGGELRDWYTW